MKDNNLTPNKVFAAFIIAVALAWIAHAVSDVSVAPKKIEKNVYVVDTSTMASAAALSDTAPKGPAPIEPLLVKADADAGQKYAKVCGTCHSFGKGEAAKMGPNLYGIIGLKHAHMEGYNYSEGMKAQSDKIWTFAALNEFLYMPRNAVAGTKMSYGGIKNDQDRANVIAWLRTLSDNPVALPK